MVFRRRHSGSMRNMYRHWNNLEAKSAIDYKIIYFRYLSVSASSLGFIFLSLVRTALRQIRTIWCNLCLSFTAYQNMSYKWYKWIINDFAPIQLSAHTKLCHKIELKRQCCWIPILVTGMCDKWYLNSMFSISNLQNKGQGQENKKYSNST